MFICTDVLQMLLPLKFQPTYSFPERYVNFYKQLKNLETLLNKLLQLNFDSSKSWGLFLQIWITRGAN